MLPHLNLIADAIRTCSDMEALGILPVPLPNEVAMRRLQRGVVANIAIHGHELAVYSPDCGAAADELLVRLALVEQLLHCKGKDTDSIIDALNAASKVVCQLVDKLDQPMDACFEVREHAVVYTANEVA